MWPLFIPPSKFHSPGKILRLRVISEFWDSKFYLFWQKKRINFGRNSIPFNNHPFHALFCLKFIVQDDFAVDKNCMCVSIELKIVYIKEIRAASSPSFTNWKNVNWTFAEQNFLNGLIHLHHLVIKNTIKIGYTYMMGSNCSKPQLFNRHNYTNKENQEKLIGWE